MQLNATCAKKSASRTTCMNDVASARLTDAAKRNYFILRDELIKDNRLRAVISWSP
ncbi:lysis system i-spanin subunit Rz [Pantoea agglomerans]